MDEEFDECQWSTIVVHPSFWWRLKALFGGAEITFCWGQNRFATKGLLGEEILSIGGVPKHMRDELKQ